MKFLVVLFILVINLFGSNKDFSLYKKEADVKGNTLLIIGGIHGDEPGGYFAPAFFEKHYKIKKGNVWVAPSVNIDSMMADARGIYKDMKDRKSVV